MKGQEQGFVVEVRQYREHGGLFLRLSDRRRRGRVNRLQPFSTDKKAIF